MIAALRVQNAAESLARPRLAQPGTVAVMTGQQVGLFSGPAYTIYKALHAVRLAEWLTESGISAVPVFWLATEDHDFAEVNHIWVFNGRSPAHQARDATRDQRAAGGRGRTHRSSGQRNCARPCAVCHSADEVAALVEEAYRPGQTMGAAFGALLRKMLARFGILYVDPMLPEFRQLAAPTLRAAVEAAPELTARVLERNRELAAAGYHAQVHVEEQTSFFFLLENGKRLTLRRNGREFTTNGRRFSTEELAARAADLSPNALLRPVVQDAMLPTVAYIGGPAEMAYLAQSEAIYGTILGRMPVAVPRAGFTILDQRSAKQIERYGLSLPDFFQGEEALRDRIARELTPPTLSGAIKDATGAVESRHRAYARRIGTFRSDSGEGARQQRAQDSSSA